MLTDEVSASQTVGTYPDTENEKEQQLERESQNKTGAVTNTCHFGYYAEFLLG